MFELIFFLFFYYLFEIIKEMDSIELIKNSGYQTKLE